MNKKEKKAFTLAELLIAMLIFALLAVILVPNVTNNAEKELFSTQLKKVQNDVQQALLIMITQNQGSLRMMCAGGSADDKNSCFIKELAKRLEKIVIYSHSNYNNSACEGQDYTNKKNEKAQACLFAERNPIYLNKSTAKLNVHNINNFQAVNLKNGASVAVIFDPNCINGTDADEKNITDWNVSSVVNGAIQPANICGYLEIDVNAGKVPNMVGKDIHYFWIVDQDGIIPFGEVDNFTCGTIDNKGRISTLPKDSNSNNNNNFEQLGCTSRILQRNKIDYY